jgi:hypothetical protein
MSCIKILKHSNLYKISFFPVLHIAVFSSFCVYTPLFVLVDSVFFPRWIFGLYVVFSFDCYSSVPLFSVNLVDLVVEGVWLLLVSGLFVLVATCVDQGGLLLPACPYVNG